MIETMPSETDAGTSTPSDDAASTTAPIAETPEEGERSENVATTEGEAGEKPKRQRTFGSLSPQEAGRKSAQARRERSLAQAEQIRAQSDGRVLLVHVPVQVGNIVARLSADAEKGDARASAELRTWMREYPAEDTTDLAALDRRTRQQVIARLLAEIEAEEGRPPASPEA